MPGLSAHLNSLLSCSPLHPLHPDKPETHPLYLPSMFTDPILRVHICIPGLPDIEDHLCEAHATEALEDLRIQLRMHALTSLYKKSNAQSQGTYTCMRTLQLQIEAKIINARDWYWEAHAALKSLQGVGDWEVVLRELKLEHIWCLHEHEPTVEELTIQCHGGSALDAAGGAIDESLVPVVALSRLAVGEGHLMMSWIWYSVTGGDIGEDRSGTVHGSFWIEWTKLRACSHCWREELILLGEEMHWVLAFSAWLAKQWRQRASQRLDMSNHLAEGLQAYAIEHAEHKKAQNLVWAAKWAPVHEHARGILEAMASVADACFLAPLKITLDLQPDKSGDNDCLSESDDDNVWWAHDYCLNFNGWLILSYQILLRALCRYLVKEW